MKTLITKIPSTKSSRRNTIRLLLLSALMVLGLLRCVTASAQEFSEGFDLSYVTALEDTAVKFEYLKPRTFACDSLVRSLKVAMSSSTKTHEMFVVVTRIQMQLDSVSRREAVKEAKFKGQKQGVGVGGILSLIIFFLLI